MNWYADPESRSFILRRFLPRLAICSFAWEIPQLPLYTQWAEPLWKVIAYVAHCTAGDVLIGMTALLLALILNGTGERANWPGSRIIIWTIVAAVAYTVWSERINLALGNWAYSAWIPVLPWIDVGLAPLLQWLVVPWVAWRWAIPRSRKAASRPW